MSGLSLETLEKLALRWKVDVDWLRTLSKNQVTGLLEKEARLKEKARLRAEIQEDTLQ